MWRECTLLRYATLIAVGGAIMVSEEALTDVKRAACTINYNDIPERVQIVGKFGHPLGTLIDLEGRWREADKEKPSGLVLLVSKLNGACLNNSISIPEEDIRPVVELEFPETYAAGDTWTFRGVETGECVIFSRQVWKELGIGPAATRGQGFRTEFRYVAAERLRRAKM